MLFKVVILESGQRYYCDLYSSIVPKPSSFDGSYDGALLPPKDWQRSSAAGLPRWLDASPRLARVRGSPLRHPASRHAFVAGMPHSSTLTTDLTLTAEGHERRI